jgi:hypothetical protein
MNVTGTGLSGSMHPPCQALLACPAAENCPAIIHGLSNAVRQRPTNRRFSRAKDAKCPESSHKGENPTQIASISTQIREKRPPIAAKRGEIDAKRGEIDAKRGEIDAKRGEIDAISTQIGEKAPQIAAKRPRIGSMSYDKRQKAPHIGSKRRDIERLLIESWEKWYDAERKAAEGLGNQRDAIDSRAGPELVCRTCPSAP